MPGFKTLQLFCNQFIGMDEARSDLAVLVLFFAPYNDLKKKILDIYSNNFYTLGCALPASNFRCDLACSLVDTVRRQKRKQLPATLDGAISEVEIGMGLRLPQDHGGSTYPEGMPLKKLIKKLAGNGMVMPSGQVKHGEWPRKKPDDKVYQEWHRNMAFVYQDDYTPGGDLPAKLLDIFRDSLLGKRVLIEEGPAKTIIQNASEFYNRKYLNKAEGFFASAEKNEVTKLLINATEVVSRYIDTLWVETLDAAGPVFRGDITPLSWLDRPNSDPVKFPVATSFSSVQAFRFFSQANDQHVKAVRASKKNDVEKGNMTEEELDEYVNKRTPKREDSLFAILCAKGTQTININERLNAKNVKRGGDWLDCHVTEREVLIHPDTVFRSVFDESGKPIRVVDLIRKPITKENPKAHWVTAIEDVLRRHGMPVPSTESLLDFQSKLPPPRPARLAQGFGLSAAEIKRIVVAFPDPGSRTDLEAVPDAEALPDAKALPDSAVPDEGDEMHKLKKRRSHWTNFSVLRQLVQT